MKKIPTLFKDNVYCEEWFDYSSENELLEYIPFIKNKKFIHVGALSNIMFRSNYDGIILHSKISEIEISNNIIKVGAGVKVQDFIDYCIDNNIYLPILTDIAGIPAEMGGILVNNATCKDTIGDSVIKVRAINLNTGEIKEFTKEECNFSYRKTIFRDVINNKWAITYIYFKYYKAPNDVSKIQKIIENRDRMYLPKDRELGYSPCMFYLKHNNTYASSFLRDNEIKNLSYNNVTMLDSFPFRFINNKNKSTGNDAYILSEMVINKVREKFGVVLERETQFI